jgi:hypothetical protein
MRFLALVLLVTGSASHAPHSRPLAQPRELVRTTPEVSPYLAPIHIAPARDVTDENEAG